MQVIDTGDAGDEAFGYYREAMARAHMGMEIRADKPSRFWARSSTIQFAEVP